MKQNEILKFLRKKRKLSQRKLCENISISRSTYSRIENENQPIDTSVLLEILDNLNVTIEDFMELLTKDTEFSRYVTKYRELILNPEINKTKDVYSYFYNNKHVNTKFFSYYSSLCLLLSQKFPDLIPPISELEDEIKAKLKEIKVSQYHTSWDYKFVANNLFYVSKKEQIELINNLVLDKDISSFELKSDSVRLAICQLLNNFIDNEIRLKRFEDLPFFIGQLEKLLNYYPSHQYSTLLSFHKARISYSSDPTRKNYNKMNDVIDHYASINDEINVKALTKDLNDLVNNVNSENPNIIEGWQ